MQEWIGAIGGAQLTKEHYLNIAQFLDGRSIKIQLTRIIIEARISQNAYASCGEPKSEVENELHD
jgi:hypothetical protein